MATEGVERAAVLLCDEERLSKQTRSFVEYLDTVRYRANGNIISKPIDLSDSYPKSPGTYERWAFPPLALRMGVFTLRNGYSRDIADRTRPAKITELVYFNSDYPDVFSPEDGRVAHVDIRGQLMSSTGPVTDFLKLKSIALVTAAVVRQANVPAPEISGIDLASYSRYLENL